MRRPFAAASGCGAAFRLADIPISPDAHRLAATSGKRAVDHALGDGEDFELLLAAAPDVAEHIVRDQPLGIGVTPIGQCIKEDGLWQLDDTGAPWPLAASGYEH